MAESVRFQILGAIQDAMDLVTGIGETSGVKRSPMTIQNYPAAFIVPGAESVSHEINTLVLMDLEIDIVLWVKTQGNLLAAQEIFLADVKKKLAEDHTLGGLCTNFTYVEADEPVPLNDTETDAGIRLGYRCQYRTLRSDPYAIG